MGSTGNSTLLPDPDGELWVFDNTGSTYAGLCSLTRLDQRLGGQQSHTIDGDPGTRNAGWLQQHQFFLAGGSYNAVVDLDVSDRIKRDSWIDSPHSGPRPLLVRNPKAVITAAREHGVRATVYQTNLTSGKHPTPSDPAADQRTGLLPATVIRSRGSPRCQASTRCAGG